MGSLTTAVLAERRRTPVLYHPGTRTSANCSAEPPQLELSYIPGFYEKYAVKDAIKSLTSVSTIIMSSLPCCDGPHLDKVIWLYRYHKTKYHLSVLRKAHVSWAFLRSCGCWEAGLIIDEPPVRGYILPRGNLKEFLLEVALFCFHIPPFTNINLIMESMSPTYPSYSCNSVSARHAHALPSGGVRPTPHASEEYPHHSRVTR